MASSSFSMVSDSSPSHIVRQRKVKEVLPELDQYNIEPDIIAMARSIYEKMSNNSTSRAGKRKQLLFFVLYEAYRLSGDLRDQIQVAEIVGISIGQAGKSFTVFSPGNTGYNPPLGRITVQNLIPTLARYCLGEESLDLCVQFAEEIVRKNPKLEDRKPREVAICIIRYFMELHGLSVSDKEFLTTMSIGTAAYNSIRSEIVKTHNDIVF